MTPERRRKNARHDYCNGAVEVSGAHTHGDKGEHVEAAINNRLPGRAKKKPPAQRTTGVVRANSIHFSIRFGTTESMSKPGMA